MATTWRPLHPDDVPQIAALTRDVSDADGTNSAAPEEAVAQMFDAPRFDAETDTVGVWVDDQLAGLGMVFSRSEPVDGRALVALDGAISPAYRGRGLGRALLDRLEQRGAELAAERLPGLPVRLRSQGGTPGSSTQTLLEAGGYTPDNYFVTMEAELADWVDPGLETTAVPLEAAMTEAVREAHNDAFRDHRNYSPIEADAWAHWMAGPTTRLELSRVVLDGERVVAYELTSENVPGVAHVELVGTRREARGRGLGRQVLVAGLRAAKEAGMRTSELEVDSTSPTSADQLYLSAGYRPVRTISRYVRDLPPNQ